MLIECWECKRMISSTARVCPQCGARHNDPDPVMSKKSGGSEFILGLGVGLLAMALWKQFF